LEKHTLVTFFIGHYYKYGTNNYIETDKYEILSTCRATVIRVVTTTTSTNDFIFNSPNLYCLKIIDDLQNINKVALFIIITLRFRGHFLFVIKNSKVYRTKTGTI
jgi:hypothetical protein